MLGFKKRKLLYLDPHWLSNEPMSGRLHITELHSQKVSDSHPNMTFVFELRNQKKFQEFLTSIDSLHNDLIYSVKSDPYVGESFSSMSLEYKMKEEDLLNNIP